LGPTNCFGGGGGGGGESTVEQIHINIQTKTIENIPCYVLNNEHYYRNKHLSHGC
jgi:hypothetical protein